MKTLLTIFATIIVIACLNKYFTKPTGICQTYFIVLDEQSKEELKSYSCEFPDPPTVIRRDGAKGFICTFSAAPIEFDVSCEGYSHSKVVLTPQFGHSGIWGEPPQEILLKKVPVAISK
jgi:hypothetical protein